MTLTLTLTPQPAHTPPRMLVEIAEDDPLIALQSLELFRNGSPCRFKPLLTAQSAIAFDYDAEFDVPLLYRADAIGVDTNPEFDETWPDLAAWLGSGWAVAAGVASSTTPAAVIYRDLASPLTVLDVVAPTNHTLQLADADTDTTLASIKVTPDGKVLLAGTTGAAVSVAGTGDYTIHVAGSSISVEGTGWSAQAPFAGAVTRIRLVAPGAASYVAKYSTIVSGNSQPRGIAFNAAGTFFFVADKHRGKILKFDATTGAFVSEFGTPGTGVGQLSKPEGIDLDASDALWVVDGARNRILKFVPSGATYVFSAEYGTTGSGNGQLNGPTDIAFKSTGNFVVTEFNNNRVQEFSPAGAYVSKFTVASEPLRVVIGASDDIIVSLWTPDEVRRYNAAGVLQDTFDAPPGGLVGPNFIDRDSAGFFYVTDYYNSRVVKYDSAGAFVAQFGPFAGGEGIKVRPSGDIFVVNSNSTATASAVEKWTQEEGSVGQITALGTGRATAATASDTETLTPTGVYAGAWLTNAMQPELALRIETEACDQSGDFYIVADTRETTEQDDNTASIPIEGSSRTVHAVLGPRTGEKWNLYIGCRTEAARRSLRALLANSAAVNLRFMASQDVLGLEGGFYTVGRLGTRRNQTPTLDPKTVYALPLTPSDPPEYDPLWQWSLRSVAQSYPTLASIPLEFPTLRALLVGPS